MNDMYYLLNISVSGIKCIKEEMRIDFYKKTINKNFDPERYRVKAIYGENGSGKSALITAVKIFKKLVLTPNYLSESRAQDFLNEIINKNGKTFRIGMEFLVGKPNDIKIYQYIVQLGKGLNGLYEIQYECLKWKNGNYINSKYQTVFECQNGELDFIDCSEQETARIEKKTINLLSTHTFLHLYFMNADTNFIFSDNRNTELFLSVIQSIVIAVLIKVYLEEEDQHELFFIQKRLKESGSEGQEFVKTFLENKDSINFSFGVNEKFVEKEDFNKYQGKVEQLTQFIKLFKPNLVSIDVDAKEDGERYVCDLNLNYGDYVINKEFESTGIKKLIRLFDCFTAASNGGIVFVDEMDSNLNDVYLCKLIEYFMYYGKGQLCFTTHNIDPMSVLKENKNSIDFLSGDNHLIPWTSRGNATPENCYKNGMIEDLPFNIEASDFVGIFGE